MALMEVTKVFVLLMEAVVEAEPATTVVRKGKHFVLWWFLPS